MTNKDSLEKLLSVAFVKCDDNFGMPNVGQVADFLVERGVICLPCAVGSKVYVPFDGDVQEYEIIRFTYNGDTLYFIIDDEDHNEIDVSVLGKEAFLNKHDAITAAWADTINWSKAATIVGAVVQNNVGFALYDTSLKLRSKRTTDKFGKIPSEKDFKENIEYFVTVKDSLNQPCAYIAFSDRTYDPNTAVNVLKAYLRD